MLCAPSLSGESFGMVLTEAFAAGTPVIASEIAGYSDVVTDGVDGVLVPPGDPQRLAEELQRAHHEPERLRAMGEAARRSAQRYAWPQVADRVDRGLRAGDRGPRSRPAPASAPPTGPGCGPPTASRSARRSDCPRSTRRRPERQAQAAGSPAASALGVAGALGDRPDRPRRAEDRRRQRGRKHRPLRRHLGR